MKLMYLILVIFTKWCTFIIISSVSAQMQNVSAQMQNVSAEMEKTSEVEECFDEDYCTIECNGINGKHTLCEKSVNISTSCSNFVLRHKKTLFGFVHAHNSLRNRIANKAKFSGMVALREDPLLVKMAENWLKQCKETEIDECANYKTEAINVRHNEEYKGISQNVAYIRSKFFPPFIKYYVLRMWYSEKKKMKIPKYNFTESHPTITWREKNLNNNFSHLALPRTSKMGCVLGSYRGGYAIVCNYYKFLMNNAMQYGAAVTGCPNTFPLRHSKYQNLCTNTNRAATNKCQLFTLAFFTIFHFIKRYML